MEAAESRYKLMSQIKGGSDIEYGEEGPIPVASGLVSIFFRPLPWEIRSIRFLFAIIETWTITILAIGIWLKMHKEERRGYLQISRNSGCSNCSGMGLIFVELFSKYRIAHAAEGPNGPGAFDTDFHAHIASWLG